MNNHNHSQQQKKKYKHKLAAIMFTDMVGYSSLSQKNETLALELLSEHRTILRRIIQKHEGREIETAGDSFFVEFFSAIDAANCAIQIQTELHERNNKIDHERQILIRIGLHIGEVVHINKNVHGDGVNIAARFEPLATPGGIALSGDFARAVRNKIHYPVISKGTVQLKNISSAMNIFCIQLPWLIEKSLHIKKPLEKPKFKIMQMTVILIAIVLFIIVYSLLSLVKDTSLKSRLAVIPLINLMGDGEEEYFVDGMTEELILALSKISGLRIIARTSVMQYKGTTESIAKIGAELGVSNILEGSIHKEEDNLRITLQLIDVQTQEHRWSQDYNRKFKDVFTIQSLVAHHVNGQRHFQRV